MFAKKKIKVIAVIAITMISMLTMIYAEDVVINVDGNWHDLQEVSIYTSQDSTDIASGSITWDPAWNSVRVLPYSATSNSMTSCWIGIPLRGEEWQVNADGKFEIRFNLSLYSTVNDTKYYANFGQVQRPNEAAGYPKWWGASSVFYVSAKGTTMTSYWEPEVGTIDLYKAVYGGSTEVNAEGLTYYKYGYMYDIVIPAGWLKSTTRTLYIPISLSVTYNDIVYMSYAKVRSLDNLSDYEILASILSAIQGINGMTPEQMTQAVKEALDMYGAEQDQKAEQAGSDAEAGIDSAINTIKDKFNIETIKEAYAPYLELITSTDTEDFVLSVPATSIKLSGQTINLIPKIEMNLTDQLRKMDEAVIMNGGLQQSSDGRALGWTGLKTLLGSIASLAVVTSTVMTVKTLIQTVVNGNPKTKDGDSDE